MATRKIINVMSMCPPYELYWNEPRPEANWDLPGGQWVGIWSYEWLDLIGREILKLTKEFEFEVWQPDIKADKIYSHCNSNGVVHRLFPAEQINKLYGFKRIQHLISRSMYETLINENRGKEIILRIPPPSVRISRDILELSLNCPKIIQYFGEFISPLDTLLKFEKNALCKLNKILDHCALNKYLNMASVVTYTSEFSRRNLSRYCKKKMKSLSIGVDFDFWQRMCTKEQMMKELDLENRGRILFASARLVDAKQIDRIITVLDKLDREFDFLLLVSGHGEESYERYVTNLGRRLIQKGKLRFMGYLQDEQLRDFYTASDVFVMSSLSEAGPTATIKALAIEVPVLSTQTGQMAEVLQKHGAGVIVPVCGYDIWERELREILRGKKVKILDRQIVKQIHHWPYVAHQYIELYRKLYEEYYG